MGAAIASLRACGAAGGRPGGKLRSPGLRRYWTVPLARAEPLARFPDPAGPAQARVPAHSSDWHYLTRPSPPAPNLDDRGIAVNRPVSGVTRVRP